MSGGPINVPKVRLPRQPGRHATRADYAQWLIDTCTLFGADLSTSLKVAACFVADLQDTPNGARLRLRP